MADFQRSVQSLYTFAAFGLLYVLIELFYIDLVCLWCKKTEKKKLKKKKKRKENLRLISYSKNYSLKVEKEILGLRTCWVDNCLHILH